MNIVLIFLGGLEQLHLILLLSAVSPITTRHFFQIVDVVSKTVCHLNLTIFIWRRTILWVKANFTADSLSWMWMSSKHVTSMISSTIIIFPVAVHFAQLSTCWTSDSIPPRSIPVFWCIRFTIQIAKVPTNYECIIGYIIKM